MKQFKRIAPNKLIEDNRIYSLDSKEKLQSNFLNGLKKIHMHLNWIHANPSKKNIQKDTENIFFKNNENILFFQKLFHHFVDNDESIILYKGKRGSGKTFNQNYFLNMFTRKLNEHNIVWFRVDVTKIYKKNSQSMSSKTQINILDYLYSQIVYVFLRYSIDRGDDYSVDPIFKKIWEKYQNDIFFDIFENRFEKEKYVNKIIIAPNESDSIKDKPLKHNKTKKIAKNIIKFLKQEDIKIIIFIDGIDNIDFYYYNRDNILKLFAKRILNFNKKTKWFDHMVLSFRSELSLDSALLEIDRLSTQYNSEFNVPKIIFKYYWRWYINKIKNLSKEDKKKFFGTEKFGGTDYSNFIYYLENINDAIKKYLLKEGIIQNKRFNLLHNLYDLDIREMRDGVVSSYIYVSEFIKNYNDNSEQDININIKDIFKKYQHIIIEAIFKNGMRYAPDIREKRMIPPYRNLGFTNLFNPTEIAYNINIPPLMFPLLLKYLDLPQNHNGVTLERLKKDFNKYLKDSEYKSDLINYLVDAFEHLLEYNYVSYDNELLLYITEKGRIVLNLTFQNIDVLHANIYFATIYKECKLEFHAFDIDGKNYITRTLENVTKYLYFLDILQKELLVENTPIQIDLFNEKIKERFRTLYLKENLNYKKLNIEPEINEVFNILAGNLDKCLENIKNMMIEDVLKKVKMIKDLKEKIYFVVNILELQYSNNIQKNQIIQLMSLPAISQYLNYSNDFNRINKFIQEYLKTRKKDILFKYLQYICS